MDRTGLEVVEILERVTVCKSADVVVVTVVTLAVVVRVDVICWRLEEVTLGRTGLTVVKVVERSVVVILGRVDRVDVVDQWRLNGLEEVEVVAEVTRLR